MIQIACGNPTVIMVQPSLHGRMALVRRIQSPDPATQIALADANRFQAKAQALACRLMAGIPIGDDRAIPGQPCRHRWSDAGNRGQREASALVGPPLEVAVRTGRYSEPRLRLPRLPPRSRGRQGSYNDLSSFQLSRTQLSSTSTMPFRRDSFRSLSRMRFHNRYAVR